MTVRNITPVETLIDVDIEPGLFTYVRVSGMIPGKYKYESYVVRTRIYVPSCTSNKRSALRNHGKDRATTINIRLRIRLRTAVRTAEVRRVSPLGYLPAKHTRTCTDVLVGHQRQCKEGAENHLPCFFTLSLSVSHRCPVPRRAFPTETARCLGCPRSPAR